MNSNDPLVMWTVYEKPRDFPRSYVARKWLVQGGGNFGPTPEHIVSPSLDVLRMLLPAGLTCVPRTPGDDPCIVEVWF